jgi:hypothetical protein
VIFLQKRFIQALFVTINFSLLCNYENKKGFYKIKAFSESSKYENEKT